MRNAVIGTTAAAVVTLVVFLTTAMGAEPAAERQEVAPGLRVGDVLDQSNWQLAKDLLPPDIIRHYEKGEYRNPIVDYPANYGGWEKAWLEATEKNATTLDVDDKGTIIDKRTGKQPAYYYGFPFPKVDPADPKAAVKIAWNHFLGYWAGGNSYNLTLVAMLNPRGAERQIVADGWFNFYDGQSEEYRAENPLNLQSQFLGAVVTPADLQGTASLTWRYRDAEKRDSVWAFVPALRRVRAVSPANRSDGYLGSDISGDDGFGFDGKPEDFEWKFAGRREMLRLVDPGSLGEPPPIRKAPEGGWEMLTADNPPTVGFLMPNWTGLSWAPTDAGLAKREVWVIEATPRDKYYLYGRIEIWVDPITWDGTLNRKFSWKGELVGNYFLMARINHPYGPEDKREWLPSSTQAYACAENIKMNRASVSGLRANPKAPSYRRISMQSGIFDSDALHRFGK
jgi:hypothetical protein